MRDAMSKMNFNFKPIDKESLSVLEKGLTPEDVKCAVEKFLHIKKEELRVKSFIDSARR
jgi:hypothetical protein